jgi:hypothetical protein
MLGQLREMLSYFFEGYRAHIVFFEDFLRLLQIVNPQHQSEFAVEMHG